MVKSFAHHGIKGQKWGVRRFQNKDGTLTQRGAMRYLKSDGEVGDSSSNAKDAGKSKTSTSGKKSVKDMEDQELTNKVKRLNLEKQFEKLTKEDEPPSNLEKTKKVVDSASNLVNQAKNMTKSNSTKVRPDLSKMTDKELRDMITRENLERQYTDLFGKESASVSKGKRMVNNVLEYGGSVLAIGSSALGIALAIKDLRK